MIHQQLPERKFSGQWPASWGSFLPEAGLLVRVVDYMLRRDAPSLTPDGENMTLPKECAMLCPRECLPPGAL